jgi:two-component system OmpR family sensor kinase
LSFNRIFWKLFASIWLTNVAIIFLVAIAMSYANEHSKNLASNQARITLFSAEIISAYERQEPIPLGRSPEVNRLKRQFRISPETQIDILDTDGDPVYLSHPRNRLVDPKTSAKSAQDRSAGRAKVIVQDIKGELDQTYRLQYRVGRPPRLVRQVITSILSLQLVLMFIASAGISALMSWRIVKPLKRLERFGRQYACNPTIAAGPFLAAEIDPELLMRGDEIGDLAREMSNMISHVEKAFNAQRSLLHDVSHELRAPLARLQVAASLVERSMPENINVQKMHAECERLNALIQGILDFSRIDGSACQLQEINLVTLISLIIKDVRFEFPSREFMVDFSSVSGVALIQGDELLLVRMMENILRNACKYSPPHTAIEVTLAFSANHSWLIKCRDHGPGILQMEANKLLMPFYRGGNNMHADGFGLGLSIAQKSILAHGGKLSLENHPDGGLLVTIELPTGTIS